MLSYSTVPESAMITVHIVVLIPHGPSLLYLLLFQYVLSAPISIWRITLPPMLTFKELAQWLAYFESCDTCSFKSVGMLFTYKFKILGYESNGVNVVLPLCYKDSRLTTLWQFCNVFVWTSPTWGLVLFQVSVAFRAFLSGHPRLQWHHLPLCFG